jgi:lipopolysaccharide/colanic/teichoic acid biosynthesis glycosyltransferase
MRKSIYQKIFKRIFDLTFAIILGIFFLPLMLVISLMIIIFMGRPVIFRQLRPGLHEKIFTLYKFRTMTLSQNEIGDDNLRLTRLGIILRALSLDELPQLFNVIKGDMSFIGPRPLLIRYLPLYSESQRKRHMVRPGLTGLAQVNGRNAISWEEKFRYDINYVERISFSNDIKIIVKTIIVLVKSVGISSVTSSTMEEFKGNQK